MSDLFILGIFGVLGYYAYKHAGSFSALLQNVEAGNLSGYALLGPNSDPSRWYQGIKPGTVTIGGQPAPNEWQPSHSTQTGLAVAGQGLGVAEGVSTVATGGGIAAGTALGTAIPIIGIGIGVVGTVWGLITAHHQQALAREGQALNDAEPRAYQAFVLVLQAVLGGEISDLPTVQKQLDQIVADYYAEVKPVQRGTWHYTADDWAKGIWPDNIDPATGLGSGARIRRAGIVAPEVCNAACYVGHYWIERSSFVVMAAAKDALAGNHGAMILPQVPARQTQHGFPMVKVVY